MLKSSISQLISSSLLVLCASCSSVNSLPIGKGDRSAEKVVLVDRTQAASELIAARPLREVKSRRQVNNPKAASAFAEAMIFIQQGEVDRGEAVLKQLQASYPYYVAPTLNLAILYSQTDRAQEALSVLRNTPITDDCQLLVTLARLLRHAHAFDEAEQAYLACLDKQPDHEYARFNLGILYELYLGDLPAALVQFKHYQQVAHSPDQRVAGWISDLSRRIDTNNQIAGRTP